MKLEGLHVEEWMPKPGDVVFRTDAVAPSGDMTPGRLFEYLACVVVERGGELFCVRVSAHHPEGYVVCASDEDDKLKPDEDDDPWSWLAPFDGKVFRPTLREALLVVSEWSIRHHEDHLAKARRVHAIAAEL